MIQLTLAIMMVSMPSLADSLCPNYCKCLWRASKITVDCSGLMHSSLPSPMGTDTQVVNLTQTLVSRLPDLVFRSNNLTNVQRLYITQSTLYQVDKQAFSGLLNLVELDLSANKLRTIPTSSFVSVPNLNILVLKDNPLKIVPKSAFLGLTNLMKIDLSNCGIHTLLPKSFSGLNRLERLYLASNDLTGVDDVEDVLPVIHELTLHDNPWNFPLSSFACAPVVSPANMFLSVSEGRHVSLTCNVEADPLPIVTWTLDQVPLDHVQTQDHHVSVEQQIISFGIIRSILTIPEVSSLWNGTFSCVSENIAGTVSTNYTVMVHRTGEVGRILDLKLEYFIILTICVLCTFVISVLCIVLTCAVIARRTILKNQKSAARPVAMPRKIKMGTSPARAPDIISDVSHVYQTEGRHRSDTSTFSLDTATTATVGTSVSLNSFPRAPHVYQTGSRMDTCTTPVSLCSSTHAVLQPSIPLQHYKSGFTSDVRNTSRPSNVGMMKTLNTFPELTSSSIVGVAVARKWTSVDQFLSYQPVPVPTQGRILDTEADKYPSDWGLPRITQTPSAVCDPNRRSNIVPTQPPMLDPRSQANPVIDTSGSGWQEHEYSQIPSLTVTNFDHHYESLPSLVNPPSANIILDDNNTNINNRVSAATGSGQYRVKSFDFVSLNPEQKLMNKKFHSLPVLDCDCEYLNYPGESEI